MKEVKPPVSETGTLWLVAFLTNTQLWIGLAAGMQVYMNLRIRELEVQRCIDWALLIAAGTILLYQVPFYWRWVKAEDLSNNVRSRWLWRNRSLLPPVSLLALVLLLWKLPLFSWSELLGLAFAGVPALAYMLPLIFWKGEWRALRQIGPIKTLIVSLIWVLVTLVLPDLDKEHHYRALGLLFAERLLFLYGLVLLFDWRDRGADTRAGVYTVATFFSDRGVQVLQLLLVAGIVVIGWIIPSGPMRLLALVEAISLLLLTRFAAGREWYYFTFVVDGALILVPCCYLLLST